MELNKKAAYLQGLVDGLGIDDTTKEGKTTVVLPSVMNDEPFAFKFSIKK